MTYLDPTYDDHDEGQRQFDQLAAADQPQPSVLPAARAPASVPAAPASPSAAPAENPFGGGWVPLETAPQSAAEQNPFGSGWDAVKPETPGFFGAVAGAARRGLVEGVTETAQAVSPFQDRPKEEDTSGVGQLLAQPISEGWSSPSWWAAQISYGATKTAPSLVLGAAGAAAGAATPIPGGALLGGAAGFGIGSAIQTLAPAYQRARAEGLDHEAAVDRAIRDTGIAGAFGTAMGLAPGVSVFGRTAEGALRRPISEALAQIFGVQPGLGAAQQTTESLADKGTLPSAEEVAQGYALNVGQGAALMAGHAGYRAVRGKGAEGTAPKTQGENDAQDIVKQYQEILGEPQGGTAPTAESESVLPDYASSAAGMPSREASSGDTDLASRNASGLQPPSSQPLPGTQVSTRPEPSENLTTRQTSPSILAGPVTTRFSDFRLGDIEPTSNKNILQASDDFNALHEAAKENVAPFTQSLHALTADIPGAEVASVRAKDLPGLTQKVETLAAKGRPASTISDYLGGRVVVDTPDALRQVLNKLGRSGAVIEAENFIPGEGKFGYRAYHLQVGLGDGTSAELQIVPRPIADVMHEVHDLRQPIKRLDLSNPDNMAQFENVMAWGRAMYDRAYQANPQWRDYDGTQGVIGARVPQMPEHRVAAANGQSIDVAPVVVEADSLLTSQDRGYDPALQPRARDRAAAQAQVRSIAANLDPERLGYSSEADRGAPIVGPDGTVESGNGRVLALRQVYAENSHPAQAYREWLASQGVDVAAYRNPVLVRQRVTSLDPNQRRAFTVAANQAATLGMSAPERAMADANLLDAQALSLIRDPADLAAAANRPFFRRFIAALPQSEHGLLADAQGRLSAEGLTRARNAILAKAYGDADVLARIAESTHDEVRSISQALVAAAPHWARLKAEVDAGRVRADMDRTADLVEAVKRTADLRSKGESLENYLAQIDAFERHGPVEDFMRMFYDPQGRRAAGTQRIADALRFYAEEAGKVSNDPALALGLAPVDPRDVSDIARAKAWEDYHGRTAEVSNRSGLGDVANDEARRGQVRGPVGGAPGEGVGAGGKPFAPDEAIRAQVPERANTEPVELAGGKTGEQFVLPGAERISPADLAARRAGDPLRPTSPQRPFGDLFTPLQGEEIAPTLPLGEGDAGVSGRRTGAEVRGGAQALPRAEQPGRPRRPQAARRPAQLSLFGGEPGVRDVRAPDGGVPAQSGRGEPAAPEESASVTKPPTRGGGDRAPRHPVPAVAGSRLAQDKIAERSRSNYRITPDDRIGEGGAKEKVRSNIEAIRVLKRIEEEGRQATPEEKAALVRYVGWGAFAQDMFHWQSREKWETERKALTALLTEDEFDSARKSTLNAHYTSPDVVSGMWDALGHLGFSGGMAIEPALGVGHFIGLIPDKMAPKTAWTGVELDPLTGRIAKALYGGADIAVQGFETLKRPSNYYDLAVSNVPFGDYNLTEKPYGSYPIHDFFFVKSLDKVRPGGIVAFITSRYTMDRMDTDTRRLLSQSADLVGAIRLPGGNRGAFAKNAGTQVTTDVLFLRKKVQDAPFKGEAWENLKEIKTPDGPVHVNEYFADHPNMMLGEMRLQGTMYRDKEPVLIGTPENIREQIAKAVQNMQEGALLPNARPEPPPLGGDEIGTGVKDGAFFLKDGKLYQRRAGQGHEHPLPADQHDRVSRLVGMRDVYDDLLATQLGGGENAKDQSEHLRGKLRTAYDAFVKKYGPINAEETTETKRVSKTGEPVVIVRQPNLAAFRADPDAWKVASIENYNRENGKASRADIQTKDVIAEPTERQINGPSDALAYSLDATGSVDLDHIAQSLNVGTHDDVVSALGDLIYHDPNGRAWKTTDEYLSGDVVKKLEEARAIAAEDPSFQRNVDALEKVQPTPLSGADIVAQFGAPWVPHGVYEDFLRDIGVPKATVRHVPITGQWKVKIDGVPSRDALAKYATPQVSMRDMVDAALNGRQVTVKHPPDSDGKQAVNQKATEEARVRIAALKEAFTGDAERGVDAWAWKDDDRRQLLEGIYNRTFNNLVPRKFDGSHLTLPGLNPDFATRQHRKDAVWRVLNRGNTLFAHVVGSGKTATGIAALMEQKRLGMINKPMSVVPNHMLEQFSREWIQAYPNAKILAASKDEVSVENRKAFLSKVASNNWDGIVITHDAFGRINMGNEWRQKFVRDQLDELERIIRAEKAEDKKSPTVKALEASKRKMEDRLRKLLAEERKDEGINFEQSGVDFLLVDEAHLMKNLQFTSRLGRVKGLAQGDSQRAEDLFLKMRYLESKRPGRSGLFMTGTPVSNTMAELWTMQRYLQLDALRERGLDNFDSWAHTFGRVVNNMELSADGRTLKDVSSFSKFVNVPELISLYSEIADTKTADMLNLPRPKVVGQDGKPGINIVEAEPSAQEEAHIQKLVELAESLKGKRPQKGEPNMLSVVTEGRKVATDGRLINPDTFDFNPKGKIALAVNNIARIYKEGNAEPDQPNKVQMVFLDMGVPKPTSRTELLRELWNESDAATRSELLERAKLTDTTDTESAWGDLSKQERTKLLAAEVSDLAENSRINLYSDLKQRLVEQGIPAKEIAFIHDAPDDQKKARLFQAVRDGKVRVLVGSTGKMGMGTNVQNRLIAMHHLDAPWKPAEVEQRDGRIVRQGNLNPEVGIYRYVTKRSFDAFMWQSLDRKAKFIGQVLSGAKGSRHAEDIDNPLPEAAEMKAAASGDPRILEHAELERQVRTLATQRRTAQTTKERAGWEAAGAKTRIAEYEKALPTAKADAERVTDTQGDKFAIELGNSSVTDRKDAGTAIIQRLMRIDPKQTYSPKLIAIGKLSGFDAQMEVHARWSNSGDGTVLEATPRLKGNASYSGSVFVVNEHTDPVTLMRRYERILSDVSREGARVEGQLAKERESLAQLEKTAAAEWPGEKEYRAKVAELDTLSKSLQKKEDQHAQSLTAEDEVKARVPQGWEHSDESEFAKPAGTPERISNNAVAYTRAYTAAERKIADMATEIGQRMAPQATEKGAGALRLKGNQVWGMFTNSEAFPHFIAWSLEKAEGSRAQPEQVAGTVRHEIIHHLREAGLFKQEEWKALSDAAVKDDWIGRHNVEDRYPNLSKDRQIEEAVAEQFSKWRNDPALRKAVATDPVQRFIRDAFYRLDLLMRRIAAGARKFLGKDATADDVFARVEAGEVGKRPSEQIAEQKRYFAERNREAAQEPEQQKPWVEAVAVRDSITGRVWARKAVLHPDLIEQAARDLGISVDQAERRLENGFTSTEGKFLTREQASRLVGAPELHATELSWTRQEREESDIRAQMPERLRETADALRAKAEKAFDPLKDVTRDLQMKMAPMAAHDATVTSRATAKDFANSMRMALWQWSRIDHMLKKNFTPAELEKMWEAADAESVAKQTGNSTDGIGLSTLTERQRTVVSMLQDTAQKTWDQARGLGMVEGEGLPSYVPRMIIDMATGKALRVKGGGEGASSLGSIGRNLKTSTPQMRERKHLTSEETEAAAKFKLGAGAEIAKTMRALPLATAKMQEAIAGRTLINKIKEIGKAAGDETVHEGAEPAGSPHKWFTLDHPAFKTWRVKESDAEGNPIFERVPIYVRSDFEGPLKAVLSKDSGKIYRALMDLKGRTMSVIMYSPLIHNAVEWGRALPAMPGKVATFRIYFEGNKAKHDPAQMREAINAGMVPIGERAFNQDITSIMEEPNLKPGRSLMAKGLGSVADIVSTKGGDAIRRGIDAAGDFWHNKLLWDRIGDLQMGLYTNFRDHLVADKGMTRENASRVAAHFANRYAGALPVESMSEQARKIANLALFSRSFTLGNLGAMKDAITGLPRDVQAQIERDVGPAGLDKIKGYARRKAIGILLMDIGLMYAGNSLLQNAIGYLSGREDLSDIEKGYVDRLGALLHRYRENPFHVLNPIGSLSELSATHENEPGKEDRILVGYQKDGTAIYARNPAGKIGEEFVGYLTGPFDMVKRKLGTLARPLWQVMANDKGFGRKVYDPNAQTASEWTKNAGNIAWTFMSSQLPVDSIKAAYDLATGQGGEQQTNAFKALGPLAGVTFSKGAPGGPAVGELYRAEEKQRYRVQQALPDIRRMIQNGDVEGAVTKMNELNVPEGLQKFYIRTTLNPQSRLSSRKLKDFGRYATPEEKERFERGRAAEGGH